MQKRKQSIERDRHIKKTNYLKFKKFIKQILVQPVNLTCALILTKISILDKCDALCDSLPLAQFKKSKNTHGGVLLLVKLYKSNTLLWVFSHFLKLYKWYQIVQSVSNKDHHELGIPLFGF